MLIIFRLPTGGVRYPLQSDFLYMNVLGCESIFTTASNASVQVAPKAKQLSPFQILFSARLALAFPTIQQKKNLVKPCVVTKNHPADS